jgi:hypothetical protein
MTDENSKAVLLDSGRPVGSALSDRPVAAGFTHEAEAAQVGRCRRSATIEQAQVRIATMGTV